MSTRSQIAYRDSDDVIHSAYCHYDGYPSHVGAILLEHYNSIDKVKELVDKGAISALGEKCDKPEGHTFETPYPDRTVYYGRDRGEEGQETKTFEGVDNRGDWLRWTVRCNGEYAYLFEWHQWRVIDMYGAVLTKKLVSENE